MPEVPAASPSPAVLLMVERSVEAALRAFMACVMPLAALLEPLLAALSGRRPGGPTPAGAALLVFQAKAEGNVETGGGAGVTDAGAGVGGGPGIGMGVKVGAGAEADVLEAAESGLDAADSSRAADTLGAAEDDVEADAEPGAVASRARAAALGGMAGSHVGCVLLASLLLAAVSGVCLQAERSASMAEVLPTLLA